MTNKFKNLLLTVAGTMITGMGIGVFLTPNKVVGGGASGIATILYHLADIPPGLSNIAINIILLIIGLKLLGKEFTLRTLLGSALISGFVQVFSYFPVYTQNTFLAALFGGVLYGMGIGLGFASGASTGGTDILGRMIQIRFPTLPIGKILFLCPTKSTIFPFTFFSVVHVIPIGLFKAM